MRTKLFKIAQAATLGFAITFTLSCSGGEDPPGGGSNFSGLPTQAYLPDGSEHTGISEITLRVPLYVYMECGLSCICTDYDGGEHECEENEYNYSRYSENIPAGRIEKGQVLLDLPENIDSKYLRNLRKILCYEEGGAECNITITPENLVGFSTRFLYVTVSGNSDCRLFPALTNGRNGSRVHLDYMSQPGTITGRSCSGGSGNGQTYGCDLYDNYSLNFSEGWSVRYQYDINADVETRNNTNNLSETGGTFMWVIVCN
jgi:hypothetical protein